ncbi:phytoene/squalene synthase family protein [Verrucomicrobia bacterium LW23]|nr:phytoene/squalene synthase family protein [Verrucomicrobia bacterium LW23]
MSTSPGPALEASYEQCRLMTKRHARTFYFASHTLPAAKRRDAYAVYAFCRYVDDEVDAAPDVDSARERAAAVRHFVRVIFAPGAAAGSAGQGTSDSAASPSDPALLEAMARHPWLPAFLNTVRTRSIPESYFLDLVRGVEMDLGPVRLRTWEELNIYCYHVASVVGLIMVHVVTEPRPELLEPAADLGRAMQLTNILRDIREDWDRDRIYLPAEELAQHALAQEDIAAMCRAGSLDKGASSPAVAERFRGMLREQIARARDYYARAEPGIRKLPRDGSQLTVWLMRVIYGAILEEIERANLDVFRARAAVPMWRKLALAGRTLVRYLFQPAR